MEKAIKETFHTPDINADQYSPLTLAYMGDCAYEIVIRTLLVHKGNTHVDRLNKRASNLAKATTQSQIVGPNPWDRIQPQDATSRHRGAKPPRRCGRLGEISLLNNQMGTITYYFKLR